MRAIGVIPARYGSTRFPGKPLQPLLGRPMIQWVVESCLRSSVLDEVIVATDDERIASLAQSVGAKAVMTDSDLPSGTDRVWAAVQASVQCLESDIIVNIQGDEPLMTPELVDQLIVACSDPGVEMATLAHALDRDSIEIESMNSVKVVLDQLGRAIYFSRFPIPHSRHDAKSMGVGCLKHMGIYAYRKKFLKRFCETPQALIEVGESLEQLRALYLGAKIQVVVVQTALRGVDSPEDISVVEDLLRRKNGGSKTS